MKIAEIIPCINVSEKEFKEEKEYLSNFISSDVRLDIFDVEEGVNGIETEIHTAIATKGIIAKCLELEKKGYDGIFVSCFDDPGVKAARECVNIPVIGPCESSLSIALNIADRISIITAVDEGITCIEKSVRMYGFGNRVSSVKSVNVHLVDLSTDTYLPRKLAENAVKAILEDGAQAIILGCTAMASVVNEMREILEKEKIDIPVIEPGSVCISLLETMVRCKLNHSRITYPFVPMNIEF